jgi:hypothetical protein
VATLNMKVVAARKPIFAISIAVLLTACAATDLKPTYVPVPSVQEELNSREAALAAQLAEVGKRYSAIDRALVFDSKDFVDAHAITVTKKRVTDLEALISERDALLQRHFARLHDDLQTAQTDESSRRKALDDLASRELEVDRLFGEWSAAERNSMRIIADLLQLAERNLGRVTILSGEPSFQDATEAARFVDILGALQAAVEREKKATSAVAAVWPAAVQTPGS